MKKSLIELGVSRVQTRNYHFWTYFFLLLLVLELPQAWSNEEEKHGVLAAGVVHNIASDRKVEKIGGIMQPEPLDGYLKRLFEELSKKIDVIDQRLQNIETTLHQQVPRSAASGSVPERIQK